MELEITEQNDNPLLNRQEVKVVIKHSETLPKEKSSYQKLIRTVKSKEN